MKVANINSNIVQQNSFKGLWGNATPDINDTRTIGLDNKCDGNLDVTYTREYFPFRDERKSKVRAVVKEYNREENVPIRTFDKRFHKESDTTHFTYKAKVMPKLSFTEKIYEQFLKGELALNKANVIKQELAKLKLL